MSADHPQMSALVGLADESMAAGLENPATRGRHLAEHVRALVGAARDS